MKNILSFFTMLCMLFLVSCTATNNTKSSIANTNKSTISEEASNLNIPFEQYLRRISGLRVTGSGTSARVEVQGISNSTLASGKSPLFVLDGRNVGTNLGTVSALVQTNQIKSVRVLKTASETSFYGVQGASGVIVITSKK